jgi:transposase
VHERVTSATGVSKSALKIIKKEMLNMQAGAATSYSTPKRNRNRPHTVTKVDDLDMCVVRRTIHEFYLREKRLPTVKAVLTKLRESIGYQGQASSLLKIFKEFGFCWRRMQDNRRILIEKQDTRCARVAFLRAIMKFRRYGRVIIYSDERYIHSSHTTKKSWSDDTLQGCMAPTSKGQRPIIVHAGTEKGFIPGTLLICKSNQTTGYHKEMNSDNYLRWVQEKLIPNLPQNSVFVIDNATYHNVLSEKCPTSSSRKEDMENWLLKNKIPFSGDLLKAELYTLIALHKPRHKRYILDDLLSAHRHTVLRLPPYHPDLNTIENIWDDVKQWVR